MRSSSAVMTWPARGRPRPQLLLDAIELPVYRVRGNADRELVGAPGRAPAEVIEWVRGRLDEGTLAEIAASPLTATLDVDGLGAVLFCHATPRNDTEIRTSLSPDARWREVLAGVAERIVVCGHTHVQFDRMVDGVRVVNAGSVGMAYEDEPGAYWAIIGPDVELRRTAYDVDATRASIVELGYPTEWGEATSRRGERVLRVDRL